MSSPFFSLASLLAVCAGLVSPTPTPQATGEPASPQSTAHDASPNRKTEWILEKSEGLDALLLIGAASGERLQADEYPDEIAWVRGRASQGGLAALATLDKGLRQTGTLTGPRLALYFSAGPIQTLDDVLASARDPEGRLLSGLQATPFWDGAEWRRTLPLMPAVAVALEELRALGFERRWRAEWSPPLDEGIERLREVVTPYDLVPEDERLLGRPVDRRLEVLVLAFCKPYGIRITGQRFLTHPSYDALSQLRTASHELFHPPFDLDDVLLKERLAAIHDDPWVRAIVKDHDPAFGYNTFEGLVNEDSAQALDQLVGERLGFARDAGERWRTADDGMHLLAAAFYHAMKEDGFDRRGGCYSGWLMSALARGLLGPSEVRRRAAAVVGAPAVDRWSR